MCTNVLIEFHPIIAHGIAPECRASFTRHISTQNEAQSMVGGNSTVLQHFIVINQHMGLHRNAEITIQASKTPKMNFTGISLQSVATNISIKIFVVVESVQKI